MSVEKIRATPQYKTKLFELFQAFVSSQKRDPSGPDLSNMDSKVIAYIRESGLDTIKSSKVKMEMYQADNNFSL